jgi:3-hydroxyacyl-[acyl-carrier-protein] dehydratase
VKLVHTFEVAADHPAFAGHFPGSPILPGALLLDEALHVIEKDRNLDLTQWQVTTAKFLAAVRPGDALAIEHSAASDGTLRFAVRSAERTALTGILSLGEGARAASDSDDI